jgi:hypothetical protein
LERITVEFQPRITVCATSEDYSTVIRKQPPGFGPISGRLFANFKCEFQI